MSAMTANEMWKKLAKAVHPDRYEGEDKKRMGKLMSDINDARDKGDTEFLSQYYDRYTKIKSKRDMGKKHRRITRDIELINAEQTAGFYNTEIEVAKENEPTVEFSETNLEETKVETRNELNEETLGEIEKFYDDILNLNEESNGRFAHEKMQANRLLEYAFVYYINRNESNDFMDRIHSRLKKIYDNIKTSLEENETKNVVNQNQIEKENNEIENFNIESNKKADEIYQKIEKWGDSYDGWDEKYKLKINDFTKTAENILKYINNFVKNNKDGSKNQEIEKHYQMLCERWGKAKDFRADNNKAVELLFSIYRWNEEFGLSNDDKIKGKIEKAERIYESSQDIDKCKKFLGLLEKIYKEIADIVYEKTKNVRYLFEKFLQDPKYEKYKVSDKEITNEEPKTFDYKDINSKTKEESDEKVRGFIRNMMFDFVVHGKGSCIDKDTGEKIANKFSDLDGKTALYILKRAGFDVSQTEFVLPGERIEGKVSLDVGGEDNVKLYKEIIPQDIVQNNENETEEKSKDPEKVIYTLYIDHHGPTKSTTSASEIVYKLLADAGLLESEEVKRLSNYIEFVNQVDNASYKVEGDKYFDHEEYSKTLLGLKEFIRQDIKNGIDNSDEVIEYINEQISKGKTLEETINEVLDEPTLRRLGFIYEKEKNGNIKEVNVAEQVSKRIKISKEALERLEGLGCIFKDNKFGKVVIDIGDNIPNGYEACRAYGCDTYIKYKKTKEKDKDGKTFFSGYFFVSSSKKTLENLNIPQSKLIRGTMLLRPILETDELKASFNDIINNMLSRKKVIELKENINTIMNGINDKTRESIDSEKYKNELMEMDDIKFKEEIEKSDALLKNLPNLPSEIWHIRIMALNLGEKESAVKFTNLFIKNEKAKNKILHELEVQRNLTGKGQTERNSNNIMEEVDSCLDKLRNDCETEKNELEKLNLEELAQRIKKWNLYLTDWPKNSNKVEYGDGIINDFLLHVGENNKFEEHKAKVEEIVKGHIEKIEEVIAELNKLKALDTRIEELNKIFYNIEKKLERISEIKKTSEELSDLEIKDIFDSKRFEMDGYVINFDNEGRYKKINQAEISGNIMDILIIKNIAGIKNKIKECFKNAIEPNLTDDIKNERRSIYNLTDEETEKLGINLNESVLSPMAKKKLNFKENNEDIDIEKMATIFKLADHSNLDFLYCKSILEKVKYDYGMAEILYFVDKLGKVNIDKEENIKLFLEMPHGMITESSKNIEMAVGYMQLMSGENTINGVYNLFNISNPNKITLEIKKDPNFDLYSVIFSDKKILIKMDTQNVVVYQKQKVGLFFDRYQIIRPEEALSVEAIKNIRRLI